MGDRLDEIKKEWDYERDIGKTDVSTWEEKATIHWLIAEVDRLSQKEIDLHNAHYENTAKIESLTEELASWNEDLEDIEGAQEVMRDEQISGLEQKIKSLTGEQDNFKLIIKRVSMAADIFENERNELKNHRDECERQYQEKVKDIGVLLNEKQELEAERETLSKRIFEGGQYYISQRELMRGQIKKLEAENLQQAKDWDDLDDEFQKLKSENAELIHEGDELAVIADEKAAEIQKKLDVSEKARLDAEEKLKRVISLIRHDPTQGSGKL